MQSPRIRIVQESEASGETKELYDEIRAYFGVGMVPDVFKLVSTRPDFLRVFSEVYKALFFAGRNSDPDIGLPRQLKSFSIE